MINEAYVSFEVAKLLKEKGFNEECYYKYHPYDKDLLYWNGCVEKNSQAGKYITAPTHQMALAWLREKGVIISIAPTQDMDESYIAYRASIQIALENRGLKYETEIFIDTYEEAVEAALKYSLKNLL